MYYYLQEIIEEVIKSSENKAILKTVGSEDRHAFHLDMENKEEASGFTFENFDITRSFFCFFIIGGIERNDFRFLEKKPEQPQNSQTILSHVLFIRKIGRKYYKLGIAGREYAGLVYAREETLPLGKLELRSTIEAIVAWNSKYKNYEAFHIEFRGERMPEEKIKECLRNAKEDLKKGIIKGTIREINENGLSIVSGKYGCFTTRWGIQIRDLNLYERYREGDKMVTFVNLGKDYYFVEFVECA